MAHAAIFSPVRMTGEDVILTLETVLTFSLLALIKGQLEVQATQKTLKNALLFFFACMQRCSHLCDLRLELSCSSERTS